MRLRVNLLTIIIPYVVFFALFPVYFAYHALLTADLIPPMLGGGWSVFTVPGVLTLAPMVVLRSANWRIHAPVLLLAAWVALYAVVYFLLGAEWQRNPRLLLESFKLICAWGCLYAIGILFRPSAVFTRASLYVLTAMAVVSLFLLDPAALRGGIATYLGFATSVVFVAMFCLALVPERTQPLVLALAVGTLFALGSRSDLLGFLLVMGLWLAIQLWRSRFQAALAGTTLALIGALISAAWTDTLPNVLKPAPIEHFEWEAPAIEKPPAPSAAPSTPGATQSTPRTAVTPPPPPKPKPVSKPKPEPKPPVAHTATRNLELAELSKSQSLQVRGELMRKGWLDIKSSPVLGVYGGQMREPDGIFGHYMHNALSAWHQFGFLPFLIYCGLCIAPALMAGWRMYGGSTDPMWTLTLYVGAFTLLLAVFAKSIFWAMPALAWGLLARRVAGIGTVRYR